MYLSATIITIFLESIVFVNLVFAANEPFFFQGVRPVGMGGAFPLKIIPFLYLSQ
ncbi:hypothetical protein HY792_02455 [Candidatus Desantisbacteria bacterium]|nr:hypothetical protein [Candidatus Desantisbacteria bacterium]